MKHPHADLLVAIAEGRLIEYQELDGDWLPAKTSHVLILLGGSEGN